MSEEVAVGKEVLSHCNKCKLPLAHIIVNMKTKTTIGKVTCKTCDATHVYKDPSKVRAKKKATGTRKRKATDSIADLWLEAVSKSEGQEKPYSPKAEFTTGDIIDHSKFGPGVVEKCFDGNKIEVIFRHEIKILMHKL
ncbi:MAG: hypothetical protein HN576_04440 [Bacteriovoracaceae bacterium]|jgi:uncharacterized Zn finger protein (UPF0148 family)|nr:hypothetical protein [Bacteriovoracaceae bacterium]